MQYAYGLGEWTYAAFDQGFAILLDLDGNRYWAIEASALQQRGATSSNIAPLLARGVLQELEADARAPWPQCGRSTAQVAYLAEIEPPPPKLSEFLRFANACIWAEQIVRRGRLDLARKRLMTKRPQPSAQDGLLLRVAEFAAYRPIWPRNPVCLFDCLALSHFLIAGGYAPELVFGVRARPFSAHCWIECQDRVLNDLTGQYASYAPICRF